MQQYGKERCTIEKQEKISVKHHHLARASVPVILVFLIDVLYLQAKSKYVEGGVLNYSSSGLEHHHVLDFILEVPVLPPTSVICLKSVSDQVQRKKEPFCESCKSETGKCTWIPSATNSYSVLVEAWHAGFGLSRAVAVRASLTRARHCDRR